MELAQAIGVDIVENTMEVQGEFVSLEPFEASAADLRIEFRP